MLNYIKELILPSYYNKDSYGQLFLHWTNYASDNALLSQFKLPHDFQARFDMVVLHLFFLQNYLEKYHKTNNIKPLRRALMNYMVLLLLI